MNKIIKSAFLFVGLCFFNQYSAESKTISVSILAEYKPTKLDVSIAQGEYFLNLGEEKLIKVIANDHLVFACFGKDVTIHKNGISLGAYRNVKLNTQDSLSSFKLQIIYPKPKTSIYPNNLEINAHDGILNLINQTELNLYVAGVIESEIGNVRNSELLKVQAVISRTYVLKHLDRHKGEGFEVCDKVHCQVFHGKCRFNLIINGAVDSTGYIVIYDKDDQLIEAVFHANCGGQTTNSEDIWSKPRSYLKSVKDTFCIHTKQAVWTKEINKNAWLQYLSKKSGKHITEPCVGILKERKVMMPCVEVSYEDLRTDWKLKSTFISIEDKGDLVVLKGRGFGHGVGMCQEGSIRMANLGVKFDQIIKFYYTDIHLFPYQVQK